MTLEASHYPDPILTMYHHGNSGVQLIDCDADHGSVEHLMCKIGEESKHALAVNILAGEKTSNALVYVRTNFAADALAEKLNRAGIVAESIHDNKSQRTKVRSLLNFRNKATSVLVATESGASMLGAKVLTIINYDLPVSAETYSRRITSHTAGGVLKKIISFCDKSELDRLLNIGRTFPGEIQLLDYNVI